MNKEEILIYLKSLNLFNFLTEDELNLIYPSFEVEIFPKNTIIFQQGDFGNKIYFIYEGQVETYILNKEGNEVKIASLQKGDYFGELAIILHGFRTSSIKTISRCKVFSLTKEKFTSIGKKFAQVYKELNKILSERLANTLHLVSEKKQNTVIVLLYEDNQLHLVAHFEKYFKKINNQPTLIIEGEANEFEKLNQQVNNHYLIIKQKILNRVSTKIDHIVNFLEKKENQFFIPAEATHWTIENIVRKILKKTIGIALSSGGAPGISHLGVLKVLQEEKIPLDFIVGTSAGALYGGCYAFNFPIEEILKNFISETKKSKLNIYLNYFSYRFSGILRSEYYRNLIYSLIGDKAMQEASIPFAAIASDLFSGQTIILKEGKAVDAILASNAAPVLVEPVRYKNNILIDGVATMPLPVPVLTNEKINIKIAVAIPQLNLNTKINSSPKIFSIYLRSRAMMAERLVNINADLADVIIKPKVEDFHMLDWKKAHQILEAGEEATHQAIKRIRYLLETQINV